jgi:hypothetical protein
MRMDNRERERSLIDREEVDSILIRAQNCGIELKSHYYWDIPLTTAELMVAAAKLRSSKRY